ncbi:MAG: hypothetical protein KJP21_04830 [Bacteroidia bacterium]|nr:hypothetical protein [Bacteroidia bacterium]NNJ55024.1 hypothetical protein [Bacteroidia bacterium]
MKTIISLVLLSLIFGCTSSTNKITTQGLKVQLEDILVTLDPDDHLIYAKISNEENLSVVDFSEYNPNGDVDFYSSISKSEDGEGVILDCNNGKIEHQLLIRKSHIIGLCMPGFFGGQIKTATPQEIEEMNKIPPVKIYKDSINGEEFKFE